VVDIKFFDEDGMDFSSTKEKKVERLFFGEEFRKVNIQEVGELSFPFHRVVEQYREGILSHINAEAIRCKNCRLIIDYAYGAASQVFPNILGDLEFDMVALNAHVDEMKITKSKDVFDKSLIRLSQIVKSVEGDLGVMFDAGAEKLFLCDEKGEILSGDKALVVVVYLFLLTHPGETVAVPINTSAAIEIIAKKFGSVVLRTKSASRDMMEVAAKQERVKFVGERLGGFIFPEFQPSFDAMFATCKIIEMINQSKVRLSEIVKEVPEPHVFKKDISCLPELKGRVMRSLVEDIKEGQIDLLDGVKVSFGDRWILVLPHPMRPIIELYAESPKEKEAQKLLQEYTRKIDDILS
jgi:mannose-1-phosphate guanylyltransferase/phosphomannomutase